MIELHVIGPRLLVQVEDQSMYERPDGLITVQTHEPGVIGTVVRCGPEACEVQEGDVVLFSPDAGQRMEYDHTQYLVLEESEVLAVWQAESPTI